MRRLNKSYIDRIGHFTRHFTGAKLSAFAFYALTILTLLDILRHWIIAYAILLCSYNTKTLYDAYGGTVYFRSLRLGLIAHVNPTIN